MRNKASLNNKTQHLVDLDKTKLEAYKSELENWINHSGFCGLNEKTGIFVSEIDELIRGFDSLKGEEKRDHEIECVGEYKSRLPSIKPNIHEISERLKAAVAKIEKMLKISSLPSTTVTTTSSIENHRSESPVEIRNDSTLPSSTSGKSSMGVTARSTRVVKIDPEADGSKAPTSKRIGCKRRRARVQDSVTPQQDS